MKEERQTTRTAADSARGAVRAGAAGREERGGFALAALAVLLGVLLLTTLGAAAYRAVLRSQTRADTLRATLGYVRTQVKNHDTAGGVSLREGMLVLTEKSGEAVYEQRIYVYEGSLWEEYVAAASPCAPEKAAVLAAVESFTAELVAEDLLRVATESGETYIKLFAPVAEGAA